MQLRFYIMLGHNREPEDAFRPPMLSAVLSHQISEEAIRTEGTQFSVITL